GRLRRYAPCAEGARRVTKHASEHGTHNTGARLRRSRDRVRAISPEYCADLIRAARPDGVHELHPAIADFRVHLLRLRSRLLRTARRVRDAAPGNRRVRRAMLGERAVAPLLSLRPAGVAVAEAHVWTPAAHEIPARCR